MKYIIIFLLLIQLTACFKTTFNPIVGNWKSISGDELLKLRISKYGRLKLDSSTDRGFEYKSNEFRIDENYLIEPWKSILFLNSGKSSVRINICPSYDTIEVVSYPIFTDSLCCGTGVLMVRDEK